MAYSSREQNQAAPAREPCTRGPVCAYEALFANSATVMLLVDPEDGAILDANVAAANFYGYPRERLIQLKIDEINELQSGEVPAVLTSIVGREGSRCSCRHRLADGSIRDVDVSTSLVPYRGRQALHSIVFDVTQQRSSESETRRHAALIGSLIDSIPDIVFYKDIDGVYLGCNEPFAEFVGRPRAAIVGCTDLDLFPHDVAEVFRIHDRRMLQSREPRHNEEWVSYPDGRRKLLETLKTPVLGSGRRADRRPRHQP